MPSPLYSCKYSSIWLLSSWLSLMGMRILPQGEVSAREQTGLLAFDAEVANLPEVEQLFVKAGPHVHVAAPDVVSEVIDAKQAHGNRRLGVDNRYEVDIVDGALAVAIDQINQAAADPLDRRDIEFHGTR